MGTSGHWGPTGCVKALEHHLTLPVAQDPTMVVSHCPSNVTAELVSSHPLVLSCLAPLSLAHVVAWPQEGVLCLGLGLPAVPKLPCPWMGLRRWVLAPALWPWGATSCHDSSSE